ncbi:MAG TPA: hypothetical protein VFF65_08825 [Phycisphaerales bacterium]|nr:hypothetical protein [Phycisphaerales bacterium]
MAVLERFLNGILPLLAGAKSFVDVIIPAGTSRLQYRVIGQRDGLVSPASAVLDVRLSTNASGEVGIAGVKIAAKRPIEPKLRSRPRAIRSDARGSSL